MVELRFAIDGAEPRPGPPPVIGFRLRVSVADATPVHSIALRTQVRILPARRKYSDAEQAKLLDLFGTPERWGKTLRDLHWATVGVAVPPFIDATTMTLPVPCDRDPNAASFRYFDALDGGDIALVFLFSGTVVYEAEVGPQVGMIPWDREARCQLPLALWAGLFAEAAP
jgi:hypothetical protein